MDNRETLRALVELAKKATPGPWWPDYAHEGKKMWPGIECKNPPAHRNYLLRMFTKGDYHDQQWNDMRFICEARNAIPALEALLNQKPAAYLSPDDGRVVNALDRMRMDDGAASYFTIPLYSSPPATVPVSELEALPRCTELGRSAQDGEYIPYECIRSLINRSHK